MLFSLFHGEKTHRKISFLPIGIVGLRCRRFRSSLGHLHASQTDSTSSTHYRPQTHTPPPNRISPPFPGALQTLQLRLQVVSVRSHVCWPNRIGGDELWKWG